MFGLHKKPSQAYRRNFARQSRFSADSKCQKGNRRMAKHSETIEIKQEVSKIIICLGVGIVLVSVAYLLSWDSRSLWPSLHVAGVVTGLYLVALLVYAMRPPMKRSVRIVVWCSMLVLIGISGFVWTAHKDRVEWQYRTILQIRQVIAR